MNEIKKSLDSNAHQERKAAYSPEKYMLKSVNIKLENPIRIITGPAGIVQVEENPVRIIPNPVGIVQLAKLHKQSDIHEGGDESVLSTQEYMKKVVKDEGEDEDFKSGSWVSATEYVNANGGIVSGCLGDIKNFLKNGKLEQVVSIIKSCSPNALSDLTVTMKYLSGTIPGAIHHKVINEEGYEKDITVVLANVSVFSPIPSMHYLNITMRNVVKVFHKDIVPGNGSGVGGSGMLMEEEEIVKLMEEEEEMADLELQVCWNVTHQEMANEEALNLALEPWIEKKGKWSRAHQEWFREMKAEKRLVEEELDEEHERQLWGFYGTI
ncbi:ribonuclease H-like domain-containing protein [Tanacetum coccineum]